MGHGQHTSYTPAPNPPAAPTAEAQRSGGAQRTAWRRGTTTHMQRAKIARASRPRRSAVCMSIREGGAMWYAQHAGSPPGKHGLCKSPWRSPGRLTTIASAWCRIDACLMREDSEDVPDAEDDDGRPTRRRARRVLAARCGARSARGRRLRHPGSTDLQKPLVLTTTIASARRAIARSLPCLSSGRIDAGRYRERAGCGRRRWASDAASTEARSTGAKFAARGEDEVDGDEQQNARDAPTTRRRADISVR
ncbi:hypothetical protein BKA93DRAFT_447573 [Sparassis latifolia]